ncbi:hypothetical protein C8Q79DRAFT_1010852 [Trametes meyenii]|nr:hypothetical protein C8Q79DRAFT_1010852 [Trametes meyenii]
MTPTLKDSDAIDKTGPRRPIVLRTLPPLSFSTPTHSVSIQLSFGSGAVSTLKPLDMAAIQPPLSALGNYSTRSSVERLDSPLFEEQITTRVEGIEQHLQSLDDKMRNLGTKVDLGLAKINTDMHGRFNTLKAETNHELQLLKEQMRVRKVAEDNTYKAFLRLENEMKLRFIENDKKMKQTNDRISTLESRMDARFDRMQETLDVIVAHLMSPLPQHLDVNRLPPPASPRSPTTPTSPYSATSVPRSPAMSASRLTVPYTHGSAAVSSPTLRNRSSNRSIRSAFTKIKNLVTRNASTVGAEIDAIERETVGLEAEAEGVPPVPLIPAEHQSAAAGPSSQKAKLMLDQPIVPNLRLQTEDDTQQ